MNTADHTMNASTVTSLWSLVHLLLVPTLLSLSILYNTILFEAEDAGYI